MISIRWKLIISYVLLSIVTAVAVGMISFFLIKNYVDKEAEERIKTTARIVGEQMRPLLERGETARMRDLAGQLGLLNDLRIRVLDVRERLLTDTHADPEVEITETGPRPSGRYGPPPFTNMMRMMRERDREIAIERRDALPGARILTVPVREDGGLLGYIEVQDPPDLADSTLARSRLFLLLAGTAAVALAVLIGLVMGGRLAGPVVALSSAVSGMADGDLSLRADVKRKDEIGDLARRVNRMADRIERNIDMLKAERDALRAFAQDASHELRTPVTALRTFNELMLGKSGEDPEKRREFLMDSRKELERLQWIVQALLTLTRFDADLIELSPEEIDISEMLADVLSSFAGRIEEKRLTVTYADSGTECTVWCDPRSISMALSNILDNAVRVSPRNARITVHCRSNGRETTVSVTDEGPGISEQDLPKIFQRFYRSADAGAGGSGLGLALADSIVKAHDGYIHVDTELGRGATFTIHIPSANNGAS